MAHEVILPKQGQSVETCLILSWKKQVGEQVREGEALVEVETDKASFEIPAPVSGTVLKILHREGEDVPVLAALAWIGQAGEAVSEAPAGAAASAAPSASTAAPVRPPLSARRLLTAPAAPAAAISPRARRLAERSGVSAAETSAALPQGKGSGPGGRILERDVRRALEARGAAAKAPAAATASGARAAAPAAPAASAAPGVEAFPGPVTEVPVKGVRKIIAERMLASLAGTAQYTLQAWANAEILTAYRKRLKESEESLGLQGITIGDMVSYAAVRTLASTPR